MGTNQYFTARDDGETWGPFPDADEAILHSIMQLAEDPDGANPLQMRAVDLMSWHGRMVNDSLTHSDLEYGAWLGIAKQLIGDVDWLIYGVEFVVDNGPVFGVHNFLASVEMLHNPNNPDESFPHFSQQS